MPANDAHIFKRRQVGGREEVKIKIFDSEGLQIDLDTVGGVIPGPDSPSDGSILEHVESETPHPAYDDGPSLTLLYANAKV